MATDAKWPRVTRLLGPGPVHGTLATGTTNATEGTMQGVVFHGERELEIMNFPDPRPGPGEVVVEMKASGMCGSDLHTYRRPKGGALIAGLGAARGPTIVGHEPCGVVAAIGAGVPAAE